MWVKYASCDMINFVFKSNVVIILLSFIFVNFWQCHSTIFTIIYVFNIMNTPFQQLSAVIKVKFTLSISLVKMQLRARQSEYLLRTCSVDTNLVISSNNPIQTAVVLCGAMLANYRTVPSSLIGINSGALLQAMLQANTEPFWNILVKTRSQLVEIRNG